MPTTAFIYTSKNEFHLHWFTPSTEIAICGHGTLAGAYYLWEKGLVDKEKPITFHTKSGVLKAQLSDGWVQLQFLAIFEEKTNAPDLLIKALDVKLIYVGKNKLDYLVEVESEDSVRSLKPKYRFNCPITSPRCHCYEQI